MSQVKPAQFLAKKRGAIAAKVRTLRQERKWGQAQLAKLLGLSQSRLSEIERGNGSFSAEQLLLILSLFNVPASDFSDERPDPDAELQNALARLGASHLHEAQTVLLSEKLTDVGTAIREALVSGSPRLVTSAAPVLLLHGRTLNLRSIQAELERLGFEHRLPWLIENTVSAWTRISIRSAKKHNITVASLQLFLSIVLERDATTSTQTTIDILDPTIRSKKTVDAVQRKSSEISRRWGIVTALTPDDFIEPLKVVLEAH